MTHHGLNSFQRFTQSPAEPENLRGILICVGRRDREFLVKGVRSGECLV